MADGRSAPNNVYTALAFIAVLVLLAGVGYVLYRHSQVFGGNPFAAPDSQSAAPAAIVTTLA